MYFTPTRLSSGSLHTHPPSFPICHSQWVYYAAIWRTEIIWGERGENAEYKSEAEGRGSDWEMRADGRIRVCHGSPRIDLKADFLKAKAQKWR